LIKLIAILNILVIQIVRNDDISSLFSYGASAVPVYQIWC